MSIRIRYALLLYFVTISIIASFALAFPVNAQTAPAVDISEAYVFRNISTDEAITSANTEGDLFVLARVQLPDSTATATADEWCLYLNDQAGCADTPADPSFPASLLEGHVFITLYESGAGTTLTQQATVKRIGHGLAGLYIDAGHTVAFGNAATIVCVESSSSFFTVTSTDCIYSTWISGDGSQSDQLARLTELIKGPGGPVSNLEAVMLAPPGWLVNSVGLITPTGATYVADALRFMQRIVPDAYQVGSSPAVTAAIATPASESNFQQMIDATATASGLSTNMDNVAQTYIGISGGAFAMFLSSMIGLVAAGLIFNATKNSALAMSGFLSPLMVGLWMRGPTFAVMAGMVVIFGTLGAWYMVRKAPE